MCRERSAGHICRVYCAEKGPVWRPALLHAFRVDQFEVYLGDRHRFSCHGDFEDEAPNDAQMLKQNARNDGGGALMTFCLTTPRSEPRRFPI